ncbi:FIST N-terminal domain-containing protein [Crocosphaera sp. UHCC 0190]|uniref:FIST signal transduction protein n=1 Tax=Crocosphaera sp. UHCC 0190 TaxID=3110246 RepID=UPI002B211985|nr:FIST N-terminal domain-containing protein [Crocosphaera sp. UHCC 0190]MEA5510794.1 FIST N-terminal domain-containing protein [Crocosphaera sp. UHCC 0190]
MTDHLSMQWTNALSTRPSLEGAVTEVVATIQQSLSHPPDLGIVFISSAYASDYTRLVPLILEKLPLSVLIGCGGAGIIGQRGQEQAQELENNPALSLSVGYLPDVTLQPFLLNAESLPDLDSSPETWHQLLGVSPQQRPHFILLADAFSTRINDLLEGLDFAYPDSIKVGGLTSSSMTGVPSALFYYTTGDQGSGLYHQGTVGLALSGNIEVEAIVAQGCRPIGQPYQVVQGERNIILELSQDGNIRPPLDVLRNLIETLNESDRQLAQHSLFIGIVRDEFQLELQAGDFLIRNLLGVDPRLGAIAIGDRVRPGQRIQFHLRDAQTSAEDLELLLQNYLSSSNLSTSIKGALMFACLGRGQNLYGTANFDSERFSHYFPGVSLGGFFCNGEIGPVGKQTFLHGYTSAFALFRQPG